MDFLNLKLFDRDALGVVFTASQTQIARWIRRGMPCEKIPYRLPQNDSTVMKTVFSLAEIAPWFLDHVIARPGTPAFFSKEMMGLMKAAGVIDKAHPFDPKNKKHRAFVQQHFEAIERGWRIFFANSDHWGQWTNTYFAAVRSLDTDAAGHDRTRPEVDGDALLDVDEELSI